MPMMTADTARAVVLYGADDLRLEQRPVREPGAGEVLLEVAAVGICGSDMHYVADGRNGTNVLTRPSVLGHEVSATVLAGGPGASIPVGSRVAIEPAVGCGACGTCRSGRYNLCPTGRCLGSPPTDGALTERLVVDERHLHLLPDDLDIELGALVEPLAVAVWAVQRADVRFGDRVLITGAGPIGLLVAQVARAAGATEIVVTDIASSRLEAAGRMGATATVNTVRDSLDVTGVDRVIECSGVASVIADAATRLRPGGRLTLVGLCQPAVDGFPLGHLQRYEIDVVGTFRYANAFPIAIDLIRCGTVDLTALLTGRFPLAETAAAVRAPQLDPSHLKVVVLPAC